MSRKEPKAKVSTNFRLDPLLAELVNKYADRTGKTKTAIFEEALKRFFKTSRK